jgi:hypothetical protein
MKTRMMAVAVAVAMAASATQLLAQSASIGGTAKDEAKKPYTDYTVRARDVQQGAIASTIALDANGNFTLPNLASQKYLVELVNKNGKVVCTEGPYDLTARAFQNDVVIDCNKVPAAWWLLGAAAAAGITAGIVAAGPASPAQ